MTGTAGKRRTGGLLVAVALVVALAGCGTRTPMADIVAAEGNRPAEVTGPVAPAAGPAVPGQPGTGLPAAQPGAAATTAPGSPIGTPTTPGKPGASTAAGTTPGSGPATRACTGVLTPIRIGQVGGWTGLIGEILAPARLALQVWAQDVNSRGGIACHPVQLFQADDGSDPTRSAAAVQDLAQNKKVVAIVGSQVPVSLPGFASKVNQLKIPAVGGDLIGFEWHQTPYMFPEGGDLVAAILGAVQVQVDRGHKKFGLITCVEAKACTDALAIVDKQLPKTGATEVYRTQVSVTATDYSAQCQAAKNAGADNLLIGLDASGLSRFMRSCKALNYIPAIGGAQIAVAPSMTNDENIRHATFAIGAAVSPWTEATTPGQKRYHQAFETYAAGVPLNGATSVGWVSAELFAKAITNLGAEASRDITVDLVLKGLGTITKDTLDGLTVPLTFKPGQASAGPITCAYGVLLTEQGWVAPQGNKARCFG